MMNDLNIDDETLVQESLDETDRIQFDLLSEILHKVIQFCTHHMNDPLPVPADLITVTEWDAELLGINRQYHDQNNFSFCNPLGVDESTSVRLNQMLRAADYLDIPTLRKVICQAMANALNNCNVLGDEMFLVVQRNDQL